MVITRLTASPQKYIAFIKELAYPNQFYRIREELLTRGIIEYTFGFHKTVLIALTPKGTTVQRLLSEIGNLL